MHLIARVRRLNSSGHPLYVGLNRRELAEVGLRHGSSIRMSFPGLSVRGIVKTTGAKPWLGPLPGERGRIAEALAAAGFQHGQDLATVVELVEQSVSRAGQTGPPPVRASGTTW